MEQLLTGLRRYFPSVDSGASDPAFFLMRCLLFRSGDLFNGFAVIYDDRLHTFTDEDCLVADIGQGHPRMGLLEDISECSVQSPPGFRIPSTAHVNTDPAPSQRNDAVSIVLTFGEGDEAGDEALMASTGIGHGHDQQGIAEKTIGTFIRHIDGAMSKRRQMLPPAAGDATAAMPHKSEQQQTVRDDREPQDGEDREQRFIEGFLRYPSDESLGVMMALECGLVQTDQILPGFAAVIGHTFWFFDYHDCLVDDIADGSPICLQREEILGCSVMKPDGLEILNEKSLKVEFLPSTKENLVSIVIETDGPDFALTASTEKNIGGFLTFIDWALLQKAEGFGRHTHDWLLLRRAVTAGPIAAPDAYGQDRVAQHFAGEDVHDMSGSLHAPARLFAQDTDGADLPGYVVAASHLLGFFGQDDKSDIGPLLVRLENITNVRLSIPAGLELHIPPGVYSEANHGGNLYMSISLKTGVDRTFDATKADGGGRIDLGFDFSRADDTGRDQVRQFMNGLLARLADTGGI